MSRVFHVFVLSDDLGVVDSNLKGPNSFLLLLVRHLLLVAMHLLLDDLYRSSGTASLCHTTVAKQLTSAVERRGVFATVEKVRDPGVPGDTI